MRPAFTLLAPDQQVYRRQRQTGGRIHRPDNSNPSHRRPVICIGRVRGIQSTLFASSKVRAAPQTWYCGSRSIIATKPCSLMMVSPTATSRHGSVPVGGIGLFLTVRESEKFAGPLKLLIAFFAQNIPTEYFLLRRRQGEVPKKLPVAWRARLLR